MIPDFRFLISLVVQVTQNCFLFRAFRLHSFERIIPVRTIAKELETGKSAII